MIEGVLDADFSVKHHWNLSQKLLELDSNNKLHQIISKTLIADIDHLAEFQKAEARFCENCFSRCENHENALKIRTISKRKGRAKRFTKERKLVTVQNCSDCHFSRTSKLENRLNKNLVNAAAEISTEKIEIKKKDSNSGKIAKNQKSKAVEKKLNSMKAKAKNKNKPNPQSKQKNKPPKNSLAGFLKKF
ncbi:Oidioi.mRNA.OKI2018_I69.PAR.g13041.t1.cds [Oikopleura dioica]|uniref:Oidioi.mRNA.OKI2018_I69.PAR.g13041.t1.cds n=1 Tax=Oikopleura dioica TaxID=34765 RepID=A0ABN7S896_OIKDI|nr:Oidioi.mRNA.OKI2018_I69.PAR.g13041.t1.cds [Oikopleura dioica]